MSTSNYQPRYVAYARAHGRSAAEMLAHDRLQHPGGCMAGYISWISKQWTAWRRLRGVRSNAPLSRAQHSDFDAWLQETH